MAEAELQGLGGELEAALQEVDLSHEEVGLGVGRAELQTVLQTALGRLDITCTSKHDMTQLNYSGKGRHLENLRQGRRYLHTDCGIKAECVYSRV